MGMEAELLALGPYKDSIANHLEYQAGYYEGTTEGSIITVRIYKAVGSTSSRALAEALGAIPSDFDTHALDPKNFDWNELAELLSSEELESLHVLVDAGFEFHFRPNA